MSECNRMKTELNFSELSVDSSTDMSDSMFSSNLSPIPNILRGRKLNFNSSDNDDCDGKVSTAPMSFSPPYKRVSALTLFDSPRTPKTVLEKCSTPSLSRYRMRLFPSRLDVPSGMPSGSSHYLHPPSFLPSMDDDSAFISLANDEVEEPKPPRQPLVNINPFTPDGQAMNKNKRTLSKTPNGDLTPENPVKRVRLRESNISRYNVEFQELGVIGRGSFGRVTKCLNKLDGCVYALKRSIRPVAGSFAERAAITEVYAHAALGKHSHVVRYYSAWAEDDHMIIQNEYCDGGSLQQKLEQGPLPESELLLLLAHISDGLSYIHSMRLVHMDLKPGNIFICREEVTLHTDSDDGYEDEDAPSRPSKHKYKIGDLGHVTCISSPKVEEGDCRYLPKEILQEDFSHLTKADIFAFGLTLFEAAGGGELPKNGQYWHDIRDGKVPKLPNISKELYELIKKMIDPNTLSRPSAVDLRRHSVLKLFDDKSKDQLYRELAEAKVKNELLTRQLEQAARCIKSLTPNLQESSIRTRASKRLARHENIDEVIRSVTVTPFHNRVKPGAKNTRETRCNKSLTPSKETGSRTRTSKRLQPRQADGVATSPRTLCSTVATRKLGNRI